ncbi:MAG: hydrogenase maturation protease [Candidatus Aminicenantes bacterium]|jgi:hydrogenase 3 maturation protease|nr:hydrogenase maturation protease [Candidatus Aminicenantes bacterium]
MTADWEKYLRKELRGMEKIVILGTGNALEADDAAGLYVASLLDSKLSRYQKSRIKVLRAYEVIDIYLKKIKRFKPTHLLIVDAVDLKKKPGTIMVERLDTEKRRKRKIGGEFSNFLEKLSSETACKIYIIGLQPQRLDFGHPITPVMKEACRQVADFFTSLISRKPE